MFTIENTDGYNQTELNTMNKAIHLLRDWYDCKGLKAKSISDAIGNAACRVPMEASLIADAAADSLHLKMR